MPPRLYEEVERKTLRRVEGVALSKREQPPSVVTIWVTIEGEGAVQKGAPQKTLLYTFSSRKLAALTLGIPRTTFNDYLKSRKVYNDLYIFSSFPID